jgi:hypothetical protein
MANSVTLPRTLLIYAITIPLALFIGFFLTSPLDLPSFFGLVLVLFALLLPFLIRSHHTALVFTWNAYLCFSFLPGRPFLWMMAVAISLTLTVVSRIMDRQAPFLNVPSITRSLLLLGFIVLVTARLRGGISVGTLGGESGGGKGYFHIFFAIAGYFALSAVPIPLERAFFNIKLFFLSGLTSVVPHLIVAAGPTVLFLMVLVPEEFARTQVQTALSSIGLVRLTGVSTAAAALIAYLLARHGVRGMLDMSHPTRPFLFAAVLAFSAVGGFRSTIASILIVFVIQFLLEGLHRTRLLLLVVLATLLVGVALIPLTPKLPLAVQRSLSFLPLNVDPVARLDAQNSTEWRLEMWRALLPELPHYFFLGKGYSINLIDIYFAGESMRRGFAKTYEALMLAGDYHNGPLSVYIPFGAIGVVAFVMFLTAALRTLYRNYRYGHPRLRNVNTFLFASFIGQVVVFCFIFGALNSLFYVFTGIVGLSVSLNHGVAQPAPARLSYPDAHAQEASPAMRDPVLA